MRPEQPMKIPMDKAKTLIEALPYIRTFFGKTFVVKYGGAAMIDEGLKRDFALDVILMKYVGIDPVIIHGGGTQVGEMMKKLGKEPEFVDGMRITDQETMDVVEMVLMGKINKEIVAIINHHGGRAVGLCGKDGGLIKASKLTLKPKRGEEAVDLGLVGKVDYVNPKVIDVLEDNGFIPVIAPIGVGDNTESYNINADLVAEAIASALKAEKLIFMTDVPGIEDKDGRLLSTLTRSHVDELTRSGVIAGGMLPKVQACLNALENDVVKTHIIDGRVNNALILEIFTDKGIGTQILP